LPWSAEPFDGGVYIGEGVKIRGSTIVCPRAPAAVGSIVGVEDLKSGREGKVFKNFSKAPAGNLGDAVDIACEPAGAV